MAEQRTSHGFFESVASKGMAFRLALGICPALAVATTAVNSLGLGLIVAAALLVSNILVSLLRKFIPDNAHTASFLVIICTVASIASMLVARFFPELHADLGIYLPLVAVNGLIFCQAECFASKNGLAASAANGLGTGLAFALILTLLGALRELLGSGSLFGMALFGESFEAMGIAKQLPGGLIIAGILLGLWNAVANRGKPEDKKEVQP